MSYALRVRPVWHLPFIGIVRNATSRYHCETSYQDIMALRLQSDGMLTMAWWHLYSLRSSKEQRETSTQPPGMATPHTHTIGNRLHGVCSLAVLSPTCGWVHLNIQELLAWERQTQQEKFTLPDQVTHAPGSPNGQNHRTAVRSTETTGFPQWPFALLPGHGMMR